MHVSRNAGPAPIVPAAAAAGRPAAARSEPATRGAALPGSSFWDLLTADEQAFFLHESSLGPLTYGTKPDAQSRAPLGGRIDVKA
jgi:hypothetical protein